MHPESALNALVSGDLEKIEAKTVFEAADLGDRAAAELTERYLTFVAEGLVNLINIFETGIIVLGGGVCARGDAILNPIREKVTDMVYGGAMQTALKIAELGNDAGIIGAARLG